MNNILLRGILGATMFLVASGALAQTTVTENNGVKHNVSQPTADTYVRADKNDNNGSNATMEI